MTETPDLLQIVTALKQQVDEKKFIDVGPDVVKELPANQKAKVTKALVVLKDMGYQVHYVRMRQLGSGERTNVRVLVGPDVTQKDTWLNRKNIQPVELGD